jgi:NAD(P)H-hydrate epimerase
MLPLLSALEMREADRRTIEEAGLPGAVLMENAGAAVAAVVKERYPQARRPLIVCGKGNNGGDGYVAARRLLDRDPEVALLTFRSEVQGDAAVHLKAYEASGGRVTEIADEGDFGRLLDRVGAPSLVIDAVFGTGLRERPTGLPALAIEQIAAWALAGSPVVAVDIPSGLLADSGDCDRPTVLATITVALGCAKPAHVLAPACDRVGELVVADIGIPASLVREAAPKLFLLEGNDVLRCFPARPPGAHKGNMGHVLVIAGSLGKTGAAVLAATGALRAGAGLVTVATPAAALPLVAAGRPEVMTEALADGLGGVLSVQALKRALALARERDVVVLGPGLGTDAGTREFVRTFVPQCPVPLVVDADGLNALSAAGTTTGPLELIRRPHPTIVTPHPGEMARLSHLDTAVVQKRRLETAREFANASGAVVVLKGQRTVVAEKGGRAAVNPTGNPGLATGGSGDVLAGVIGALLCRHDAWTSATAGAYLHGLAGDRVAARNGESGMLATDVANALPEAVRWLAAERSEETSHR